jgi:hypothetical protein
MVQDQGWSTNHDLVERGAEEDSQTFDRRVSPLVGAAAHESNAWVLSDKGRKREINSKLFDFGAYIKQSNSNNAI